MRRVARLRSARRRISITRFAVLPQHKSDAMCAVYAFMRKADDLSDDESMSSGGAARGDGGVDGGVAGFAE